VALKWPKTIGGKVEKHIVEMVLYKVRQKVSLINREVVWLDVFTTASESSARKVYEKYKRQGVEGLCLVSVQEAVLAEFHKPEEWENGNS
jgi:folate-binding Fe-S cluster repair protein YgfZ